MKKMAAIALALIIAMSSMFATVATAANVEEIATNSQLSFAGFEIPENSKVVVDVENMLIYGLKPQLHKDELDQYLKAGKDFTIENDKLDTYLGTGSQIILKDKEGNPYPFTVVIFGDLTGDSVYDVLDAAQMSNVINGFTAVEETYEKLAIDNNNDGEIDTNDYIQQVNAIKKPDVINQNATGTEKAGTLDVVDQVYVSDDTAVYTLADEDVTLTFNDAVINTDHYDIVKCDYKKDKTTGEIYGEVIITGKGLFSGEIKVRVDVVPLLEKIVATVNGVIADAKLTDVVKVEKADKNINVVIDAGTVISGDFAADVSALNGLLAKIDDFRAKNLKEVSLVVEDYALASNGAFNRSEIKALGFDLVSGIFTAIANADNNIIKSYNGTLVTNAKVPAEDFTVNFVMDGTDREIAKVKDFAAKIANYVSFDTVDGNAVVNLTMPAGFATTIVDVLADGNVENAITRFNGMKVGSALGALALVEAEMMSPAYANAIKQIIAIACKLDTVADKALKEVTKADVIDVNGKNTALLNGKAFDVDGEGNLFNLISAVTGVMTEEALNLDIIDFVNNGVYTAEFDVAIEYKGISEKVIVNFDLFGNAKAPNVIDKTADHFNGIIAELGIANVANVAYDADTKNAVATLNASAFINNEFEFKEEALDGLYTDIKGYFDDNYGTSTILVGDYEIVKAGAIDKTALKNFLFNVAKGFFLDVADLGADNLVRNFSVKVTEADGSSVDFDMDFVLEGTPAHIAKIKNIAAKVANCVSFKAVNGTAVVDIALPASFRALVIDIISDGGTAEEAMAEFNKCSVKTAFGALSIFDAEAVSAANAADIERIIVTVAEYSSVINKLLGKVTSAKAYDLKGNAYNLLNGKEFDGDAIVNSENKFSAAVLAVFNMLDAEGVLKANVSDFTTGNGVYTVTFEAATSIGGISEKVIVNFDMFGIA